MDISTLNNRNNLVPAHFIQHSYRNCHPRMFNLSLLWKHYDYTNQEPLAFFLRNVISLSDHPTYNGMAYILTRKSNEESNHHEQGNNLQW